MNVKDRITHALCLNETLKAETLSSRVIYYASSMLEFVIPQHLSIHKKQHQIFFYEWYIISDEDGFGDEESDPFFK